MTEDFEDVVYDEDDILLMDRTEGVPEVQSEEEEEIYGSEEEGIEGEESADELEEYSDEEECSEEISEIDEDNTSISASVERFTRSVSRSVERVFCSPAKRQDRDSIFKPTLKGIEEEKTKETTGASQISEEDILEIERNVLPTPTKSPSPPSALPTE